MTVKCTELRRLVPVALLAALVSLTGISSADTQPSTATPKTKPSQHSVHHHKTHKARVRGQKAIDGDRARQIQQALIREHYLKGEPSGNWDASTQQAMRRYQADQGWQSKTVPDSRALIRLGLGPDSQHLLNPESAMMNQPGKQQSASTSAAASPSETTGGSMPAASSEVSVPSSAMPGTPSR